MNHLSERALKEWLITEGLAVPIYTGLNGTEINGDEQLISCYCANSEHVAGPLHTVNVEIILSTPPHHSGDDDAEASLSEHSSVLATLRGLIEDFDQTSLKTVFEAETPYRFAGGFLEGEDENVDEDRWISKINFKFGVDTSG